MSTTRIAAQLKLKHDRPLKFSDYVKMVGALEPGSRAERYDNVLIAQLEQHLRPMCYRDISHVRPKIVLYLKLGEYDKVTDLFKQDAYTNDYHDFYALQDVIKSIEKLPSQKDFLPKKAKKIFFEILKKHAEEESQFFAAHKAIITLALKMSDYDMAVRSFKMICLNRNCSDEYLIDLLKSDVSIAMKAEVLEGYLNINEDKARALRLFEKLKLDSLTWQDNRCNDAEEFYQDFIKLHAKEIDVIRKAADEVVAEKSNWLVINGRRFG